MLLRRVMLSGVYVTAILSTKYAMFLKTVTDRKAKKLAIAAAVRITALGESDGALAMVRVRRSRHGFGVSYSLPGDIKVSLYAPIAAFRIKLSMI